MKTKILFISAVLGGALLASAQFNGNQWKQYDGMFEIVLYDLPVNGTPYLEEIYKKGTIIIENPDNTLKEERLMRFNAFTGQMLYLGPDGQEHSLLKRENITVELDDKTFEVHPVSKGGDIEREYFIPLNPGQRVVLYQRPVKNYRRPALPEHGYEDTRKPEYFDASEFFLRIGDDPMEPISLRKASLIASLGNHRDTLKEYIARNNLNLRKLEDAMQLVAYYNSLEAVN
ncbi:hypothetical protein [Robiginitalea sp. SC105]|uniref:hypothetical protein n=1 Tax=Robiginitalea sp. SC105 TaxID=2762332 RepID=UPI00163ABD00|nr:hypothetical protein [Robiginitalea sp. SC105]MBC2838802.1 hypothetical protein [Robiginitalea sp. SC105]